jgi:hypothetical protein
MVNIQTYKLEPFLGANTNPAKLTTEWLREGVNKLMRENREALENEGADISLFFNHDPDTGTTRIGYPLIIYHYLEGVFYITGINNGAVALSLLAAHYAAPFNIDNVVFNGFMKLRPITGFELALIDTPRLYTLTEWLPLHHKDLKSYRNMDMLTKVTELNKRLQRHIVGELGKYLEINLYPLIVTITYITKVYPNPVIYKGYEYPAYDIRFLANVSLPGMITLGNNKALGYGRVGGI